MGGKKGNKSKKSKTKVQKLAEKRHADFKKTVKETGKRVQTFGGTKKKYTKAEARALEQAHGGAAGFSRVTKGAANPLNRADTSGIKAGDVVQPIKDFNEFLGNDYSMFAGPSINYNYSERPPSDISFSDAVRATGGARFNEAGRNDVNRNVASAFSSGSGLLGRDIDVGDGVFRSPEQIKKMYLNPGNFNLQPGDRLFKQIQEAGKGLVNIPTDTKLAYGGPDDLGSKLGIAIGSGIVGGGLFIKNKVQEAAENLRKINEQRMGIGDQSYTGISNMSNLISSLNPVANLANLGIQSASAATLSDNELGFDRDSFNSALEGNYDPDSAGGLNIGGNFGLSAEQSDRLGRVFQQTPSPRMLSEGGDLRMSDMFEADTQGAKISKGINTIKNKIPLLNMLPDMKINTVAEEAQRRYLGYNPNLPASALARMDRRGGGGTRLPMTPTVAQEVAPQYQPVPSASTTPTTQTGVDPNRLLQIQQQAYAQAYNPMLIGGFNPQFRFGGATPTIDYSSYFNY